MSENNSEQFIAKKAYEISYALFRMAAVVRRPNFAEHMESRGLSLIDAAVTHDYERTETLSRSIEYLLRFGADVGVLNRANVEIIARELLVFNSAIAELRQSFNMSPIAELNDVFSKLPLPVSKKEENNDSIISLENKTPASSDCAPESIILQESSTDNRNENGNHGMIKSVIRQSAILERIRQNGNCRLKEIQEFLPETSERTIRYDIQNLIEQGLVERVGSGGPATHYKTKEIASLPQGI